MAEKTEKAPYTLDCTVAAILVAGCLGRMNGGASAKDSWQRYREILTLVRATGGPEQSDIPWGKPKTS
jgi:hypothetical protein